MANWAKLQEDLTGLPVFKRAKHGIHFQRSDGQIQANFVGKPCHYLDGKLWKPIDTKLLALGDGFYGCPHSPVRVHADGRVKVTGSDYAQFTELPGNPIGKVDGDRIIREFAGGYQELFVTEDGFREVITVLKPTFPLEKFIGKSSGALPTAYKVNPQTATDAEGNVFVITADTKAFGAWLDKAVYPVVIDPDFAGGANDGQLLGWGGTYAASKNYQAQYITNNATGANVEHYVSAAPYYFRSRIIWLFDTSSIGDGDTVTQVNLKLYYSGQDMTPSGIHQDVLITKTNWYDNYGTMFGHIFSDDLETNPILLNTETVGSAGVKTSGNLDTSWVSKTGNTTYGLIFKRDREDSGHGTYPTDERCSFYTANHATESYRPVLTVTYTAASTAFVNILDHTNSVILGGSIVR